MPLLQFGQYKPDVADYETDATKNILNVIPRGDGYGPFSAFAAATSALPAACRGAFYALKSDGSVQVFAGTEKMLYQLNNTTLGWTPVSRLANCTISNASPGVVTYSNTFAANDPLVFAAGSTSTQKFTVTNSAVAATDTIIVNQKSGTDRYQIFVTAVGSGSFDINFATLSGTTVEQPVFNFAVVKAVTS